MTAKVNPIKIVQISDLHLVKDNSLVLGTDTNKAFNQLMKYAETDFLDADAIFLTGDLSQDESIDSYEHVAHELRHFTKNIFWIPGNHDSIENMHAVFDQKKNYFRTNFFSTPFWNFIFLNTKIDGKETGFFYEQDLALIKTQLKSPEEKPIALVMHHHPVKMNTPLIDDYIIENKEEIFDITDNSRVKLIMCGHVHNDYSLVHKKIAVETAPATCFQFQKGVNTLRIEHKIGYKIYYFSDMDYVAETKIWDNPFHQ